MKRIENMNLLNEGRFKMKKQLNTSLILLGLICSLFHMNCSEVPTEPGKVSEISIDRSFQAEDPFYHEFPAGNFVELTVQGMNGDIKIRQNPGSGLVKISAIKRVKSSSTADAESHLNEIDIQTSYEDNRIMLETKQPKNTEGRDYSVDYTISLPENINVVVYNENGDISLFDISADIMVITGNGKIKGKVNLPFDGSIVMQCDCGSIDLEIPKNTSAEFYANTEVGKINLNNLHLNNAVQGDTSLEGVCGNGDGFIDLATAVGNIQVTGF
jgi:hypothetical protein